jgi:hypothetical protein
MCAQASNCAGEGCAGLVSIMSAGDVSSASKSLAAATLNEFLLPPTPPQVKTEDCISPYFSLLYSSLPTHAYAIV